MELREDKSKYEEKGVEDEDGLRDIVVESDNEKDAAEEENKNDDKGMVYMRVYHRLFQLFILLCQLVFFVICSYAHFY